MKRAVIVATFDVGDHLKKEDFVLLVQDILMVFNEEHAMKDIIQLVTCSGAIGESVENTASSSAVKEE